MVSPNSDLPVNPRVLSMLGIPVEMSDARNLLGLHHSIHDVAQSRRIDEVTRQREELQRIATGLGRWEFFPHRRLSTGPYQPADVPGLRFLAGLAAWQTLNMVVEHPRARFPDPYTYAEALDVTLGLGEWISSTPPFLIPDAVGPTLVEGHALDPDLARALTLPFARQTVWFSTPMRIDVDRLHLRLQWEGEYLRVKKWMPETSPYGMGVLMVGEGDPAALIGLGLSATTDGHLADEFCWIVSTRVPPTHTAAGPYPDEPYYFALPARLSATPLADLVRLVAAALTWGRWQIRHDLPAGVTGKALRAHLRQGKTRKAAASGRLNPGVHVLDLARTVRPEPSVAPESTIGTDSGRTVSPHLRRAHWRRARCGPRTDWHYEGRLIMPTIVGGQASFDPGRIYRLPIPQEALNLPPLDDTLPQEP